MYIPCILVSATVIVMSAQPALACDPIVTPARATLERRDVRLVLGRYLRDGTFLVENASGVSVPSRPYRLFERGPFGSQCEIRVMKVSPPTLRHVATQTRFLLPIESRSDDSGKMLVVMGYSDRLIVTGDKVTDQYFGTSIRLSDLGRRVLNAPSSHRRQGSP